MGIGTLRIQDLEYGQSHLTDGARRARRLWPAIITANGAQTKAELKRLITRCDRHFTVELDDDMTVELPVTTTIDAEVYETLDEWLDAMSDDPDLYESDALHEAQQMFQAYDDDGIEADVPTSSIYGTDLELWDADEWTQLGFSIVTPR